MTSPAWAPLRSRAFPLRFAKGSDSDDDAFFGHDRIAAEDIDFICAANILDAAVHVNDVIDFHLRRQAVDRTIWVGTAPMAAMSLRFEATALKPTSCQSPSDR